MNFKPFHDRNEYRTGYALGVTLATLTFSTLFLLSLHRFVRPTTATALLIGALTLFFLPWILSHEKNHLTF